MSSIIFLVEARVKPAQEIVNSAIKGGFEIFIFKTFASLLVDLEENSPDGILIHSELLPDSLEGIGIFSRFPTIIYGAQIDVDQKLDLYQAGVLRVIDAQWVDSTSMIALFKYYHHVREELPTRFYQEVIQRSWRDISLPDEILDAIFERKSLTIKMIDNGWYGKLQLNRGRLHQVLAGEMDDSDAILQSLQQKPAHILIRYCTREEDPPVSGASTYAHLLENDYQLQQLQAFLNKLGGGNVVLEPVRAVSEMPLTAEAGRVLSFIGSKGIAKKILRNREFNLLKTIRILQDLIDRGMISTGTEQEESSRFGEDDCEFLQERLFKSGRKRAQILILATGEEDKHQLMETIARAAGSQVISKQGMEVTDLTVDAQSRLYFIGTHQEINFQAFLQSAGKSLSAGMFMVDFSQKTTFDYKKYFIRRFINEYQVPIAVGMINTPESADQIVQEVQLKLEIPAGIPVAPLDVTSFSNFRNLLFSLLNQVRKI